VKLTVLGAHKTDFKGGGAVSILVDGRLAIDAGSLTGPLSLDEQAAIEAILISHRHFDHVKDLPLFGLNTAFRGATPVYTTESVRAAVLAHLFNPELWLVLTEWPPERPSLRFEVIEPHRPFAVGEYLVTAVPVDHGPPTVGFHVSRNGRSFFYGADCGPGGLTEAWRTVRADLLVLEVSFANAQREAAERAKHLTPELLGAELRALQAIQGRVPPVLAVHFDPAQEDIIRRELAQVSARLGIEITPGFRGLTIEL
jgi:ribonuclease BN (tRNA processing enzyme)